MCGDDINKGLVAGAGFGRDCDTIASALGCVLGALHGSSVIRSDWISQCESANKQILRRLEPGVEPSFRAMADALVVALHSMRGSAFRRAADWDRILE